MGTSNVLLSLCILTYFFIIVYFINIYVYLQFDGESGDNFKRAAATFCAKQQIGLENLRDKRRKDARFNSFLTESELDSVCRRLGIKDMIPMAMQRLTKYDNC